MSPTRERILDALESVVAQDGPAGATLEAVAAKAGISKGGLLYHFGTKEALYRGLLDRLKRLACEDVEMWRRSEGGIVAAYLQASTIAEGTYTATLLAALRLLGTSGVDVEEAVLTSWTRSYGLGARLRRTFLSASSTQTGAWSLVFSQPRTWASTWASLRRSASVGLSNKWSIRRPALRP